MSRAGRDAKRVLAGLVIVMVAVSCTTVDGSQAPTSPEPATSPTQTASVSPTSSAPASPTSSISPPAAGERGVGITWEGLEGLTLEMDGETVQLEGGRASVSYGGASEDIYMLQNRVAQGDLDGDGDDDAVVHIVTITAGTGNFHFVVPVIDNGETLVAQRPVPVGDRVVMDRISVEEGLIEVSLFDREEDEPFTVITRHKILEIDFTAAEPRVRVIKTEPIADLPLPDPDLPDIDIRFEPGAIHSTVSGSIEFGQRQTYIVQATAEQAFTAALDAPLGVWLDIRLNDRVITSAIESAQRVEANLPATGGWRVSAVSAHASSADYELTVEVLPLA